MKKERQTNAILAILTKDGLSIDGILTRLDFPIEKRTLQRRLKELKDRNQIIISGEARARRYFPKEQQTEPQNQLKDLIPLSPESKKILAFVSQSEAHRIPVGYNRDFLENYRPNVDSYLTSEDKKKLVKIGKTQGENQPAGTYAQQILNRLLIDLSWNSSRLEGNTYSLLDTELLIYEGKPAGDKSPKETQMILNHKDAIEFLVDTAEEIGFNRYTILNLHALLSNNLLPNPAASGRLREFGVGITNSVFTPLGIPQLISGFFDLILEKVRQIENPFEQAFFILVHFPYLQPFDDVNKRVSRLAANIPLNRHNLAPLSFIDVPETYYVKGILGIYEQNRVELFKDVFMWAYQRSAMRYAAIRQSLGEPDTFRLKYREEIRAIIVNIILTAMPKEEASIRIKSEAKNLPPEDQARFAEAVETELISMHEGNFARYRITPSEFKKWKTIWEIN
ncbi:Fic family protein [Sinomicrobium sp. M5D2P17]